MGPGFCQDDIECVARATSTTVIPAKAGTHTPRRVLRAGAVVPASRNNQHLWLWVPAFAGTALSLWTVRWSYIRTSVRLHLPLRERESDRPAHLTNDPATRAVRRA